MALHEKMPKIDTETPCKTGQSVRTRRRAKTHRVDEVEDEQGASEHCGPKLPQSAFYFFCWEAAQSQRREHILAEHEHRAHENHCTNQAERESWPEKGREG